MECICAVRGIDISLLLGAYTFYTIAVMITGREGVCWVADWASNECKRRKIKCNGQVPCQRCGHLNLECKCGQWSGKGRERRGTDDTRSICSELLQ